MKKIMFNDKYGLTQAVLEGRKTQTRRIVPQRILDMVPAYQEEYWNCALESISVEDAVYNLTHGERRAKAPYYVGEEVAVAQSYFDCGYTTNARPVEIIPGHIAQFGDGSAGWNNKMFVKANLMLHRIKIMNIRVERLQDISDADCLKEGIKRKNERYVIENEKGVCFYTNDAILAFRYLIDKICGKGTWQSNPYVFVYDFELIK